MKKLLFAAVFIKLILAAGCFLLLSGCSSSENSTATEEQTGEAIVNDANSVSHAGAAPNTVNPGATSSMVKEQVQQEQDVVHNAESYIFDEN